jgi:catechol 2,3-dioxygenase-like lactoylglutathione lyase family enzyme
MNPRSLSHVALGVRDYDRSLHFYRDLLGFQVSQEVTEFGGTDYEGGISERSDRKYRIAVLRYGKETSAPYGMSEDAPVIALVRRSRPIRLASLISASGLKGWIRFAKNLRAKG